MKEKNKIEHLVIALDQAFGSLRMARENKSVSVYGIDLNPGIETALERIARKGIKISLTPIDALPDSQVKVLLQFLPYVHQIIQPIESFNATSLKGFENGKSREHAIVVAADRAMRGKARDAGALAAPHLVIAEAMLSGQSPQFVRCTGNREAFERLRDTIPYFIESAEHGKVIVLACMTRTAIAEATARDIHVEVLQLDIEFEDPVFVHLDSITKQVASELSGRKVLSREPHRVLFALGPETRNDEIQLHGRHGHFLALSPNPGLFAPPPPSSSALRRARVAVGRFPLEKLELTLNPHIIDLSHLPLFCPTDAATFQSDVDRYSGNAPLDAAGPVVSRHITHPDNARVVQALLDELNGIGYVAYTHSFTHAGRTLHNVIADLPGVGIFRISPDLLKEIRDIFLKFPEPDPPDPWLSRVASLTGQDWIERMKLTDLGGFEARQKLEGLLELKHHFPWWLKFCPLPGWGSEIVIVGCHLDSTASRASGYNPAVDPAPGMDDDGSGIAATLSLARYLWGFRGTLPHTVRFCFFNAEEHGLVGSRAYATMLKANGAPVRGVVCSDMIGYNSDAARLFEVHAGYTDSAVRDISQPLADTIAAWAASLGSLPAAQIYRGTNGGIGSDRNVFDGAINRSDHASFHEQGYPAVVVSEDFFVNLSSEPGADPNPNYHDEDDNVIDSAYAADITCAVAHAVRELAGG